MNARGVFPRVRWKRFWSVRGAPPTAVARSTTLWSTAGSASMRSSTRLMCCGRSRVVIATHSHIRIAGAARCGQKGRLADSEPNQTEPFEPAMKHTPRAIAITALLLLSLRPVAIFGALAPVATHADNDVTRRSRKDGGLAGHVIGRIPGPAHT